MKRLITLLTLILIFSNLYATHNRGGSIEYKHIAGATYEITVTTYSDPFSPADRDSVEVRADNNSGIFLSRTTRLSINQNIQLNIYSGIYTFPGQGNYILSVLDPNRIHNIVNISGSVNVPFYIESAIVVDNSNNNSSAVAGFPIFYAEVGKPFTQNLSVFDIDGDKISYELVAVKQNPVADAPGYYIPANVQLNNGTGEFTWNAPSTTGTYSFNLKISECRNNQLVGSVMQEFQVIVVGINTNAQFQGLSNWQTDANGNYSYSLNPGDTLDLTLTYQDNIADSVRFGAFSEPVLSGNSMDVQLIQNNITSQTINYTWIPGALDARCEPYIVTFRGLTFHGAQVAGKDVTLIINVKDQNTTNCNCTIFPTAIIEPDNVSLTVAPNPFKEFTILSISKKVADEGYDFSVYDISGKKVLSLSALHTQLLKFERGKLPSGVYFYQIATGSGHIKKGKLSIVD